MKLTHSEKAKQTLELMNCGESNWFYPEIEWKAELRMVQVEVRCSKCDGSKEVYQTEAGEYVSSKYRIDSFCKAEKGVNENGYLKTSDLNEWIDSKNYRKTRCQHCHLKPSYGTRNHWSTYEFQDKEVMVGYIKWIVGTDFDSRFHYSEGTSNTHCELCAKGINRSNRVPVQCIDETGKPHGMMIGEDCAKRILSIKNPLKKDQYLADNFNN